MKKFDGLGRSLSKADQKKILGGVGGGSTCSAKPDNCGPSCSCDGPGTNKCESSANAASCDCSGTIVDIKC